MSAPPTVPLPPMRLAPPMTTAAMANSSYEELKVVKLPDPDPKHVDDPGKGGEQGGEHVDPHQVARDVDPGPDGRVLAPADGVGVLAELRPSQEEGGHEQDDRRHQDRPGHDADEVAEVRRLQIRRAAGRR